MFHRVEQGSRGVPSCPQGLLRDSQFLPKALKGSPVNPSCHRRLWRGAQLLSVAPSRVPGCPQGFSVAPTGFQRLTRHPTPRQSWDDAGLCCLSSLAQLPCSVPPPALLLVGGGSRKWHVHPHPPPHTPSKCLGVKKGLLQAFEPLFKGIIEVKVGH